MSSKRKEGTGMDQSGEHAPSSRAQKSSDSPAPPQKMMNQLRRRGGAFSCWGLTLIQKKMEWSLERCSATEQSPASILMTVPCSGGMLTQEPMKSCQSWQASTLPPPQHLCLVRDCLALQAT